MIGRRQLAVASPVSPAGLFRAVRDSFGDFVSIESRARARIASVFEARGVVLTDSGTSALVLALRLATSHTTTPVVGYPGYACVDLAAAAQRAGVRVRLYDLEPDTLSPNLTSVEHMLARGVDAVVVAHLFGYAADVRGVRALAERYGVPVIEDAAQGAGGAFDGRRLGSLGDLGVLSFGRGKGLCAGGGGALLASTAEWSDRLSALALAHSGPGWSALAKTAAQWLFGRPALYGLPSMIPWLHLGEMVYHPAGEPASITSASSSLIDSALVLEDADVAVRRTNARLLEHAATSARHLETIRPIAGSNPGYLRYPIRERGKRPVQFHLGITRPYPKALDEQQELAAVLMRDEPDIPGARDLALTLRTLPTHRFVRAADITQLEAWMRSLTE